MRDKTNKSTRLDYLFGSYSCKIQLGSYSLQKEPDTLSWLLIYMYTHTNIDMYKYTMVYITTINILSLF